MRETRCSGCGRAFVEITIDVGGEDVVMRSCSNCDIRSWHGPSGELALDGVLAGINANRARR